MDATVLDAYDDIFGDETSSRSECLDCERPSRVCWCPHLPNPKLDIVSKVLILQHPNESKRGIRTALMAVRGIEGGKCWIEKGRKFPGQSGVLRDILSDERNDVRAS